MSREEFENYVALLGRLLRLNSGEREAIRWELEDHMESRVAELEASGLSSSDATRRALEEFGDAALLARQLEWANRFQQRRWIMRFTVFSVVATFVVAVLLMAMWPQPARFGTPQFASGQDDIQNTRPQEADKVEGWDVLSGGDAGAQTPDRDGKGTDDGGQGDRNPQHNYQPSAATRASIALENSLQKVSSMEYDDVPFYDVMESLAEELHANVILDQTARDNSLTESTSISFSVRDVPLKTALRLMLHEVHATYFIDDGVLRIISLDVAEDPRFMRRKIFDCRSIINRMVPSEQPEFERLDNTGLSGLLDAELEPRLAKMVTSTVAPVAWTHTNGDASFEMFGGMAIVVASEEILDEIQSLLQDFEYQLATSREPMTWRYVPGLLRGTDGLPPDDAGSGAREMSAGGGGLF